MVVDRVRPLFELYRALFLFNKFISYVAFYIGPIQTGFPREFQKSYNFTSTCGNAAPEHRPHCPMWLQTTMPAAECGTFPAVLTQ